MSQRDVSKALASEPGSVESLRPLPAGLAVTAHVPASSANLGPGYDCLGLALGLYDDIVVQTTTSGLTVRVAGESADEVPWGPEHLVVRAITRGLQWAGFHAAGMNVLCRNVIPHSRGLGSSAAAVVGGLAAARGLVSAADPAQPWDEADLVQLAAEFEGHPDNAAASVLGGVVASWTEDHAQDPPAYRAVRLAPHPALRATVLVSPERSSTAHTRSLLPVQVPYSDAAFNASRAALAVVALTQRPELLLPATDDRLHQCYRAEALASTTAWVSRLRAAGIAAMVSGAGPTVLALGVEEFPDQLRNRAIREGFAVLQPGISDGVRVR